MVRLDFTREIKDFSATPAGGAVFLGRRVQRERERAGRWGFGTARVGAASLS